MAAQFSTWQGKVGIVLASGLLVLGLYAAYQVRRAWLGDDMTVCIVTARSLTVPGNVYGIQDHDAEAEAGAQYFGTSGCYPFETVCVKQVSLLRSRLDC